MHARTTFSCYGIQLWYIPLINGTGSSGCLQPPRSGDRTSFQSPCIPPYRIMETCVFGTVKVREELVSWEIDVTQNLRRDVMALWTWDMILQVQARPDFGWKVSDVSDVETPQLPLYNVQKQGSRVLTWDMSRCVVFFGIMESGPARLTCTYIYARWYALARLQTSRVALVLKLSLGKCWNVYK